MDRKPGSNGRKKNVSGGSANVHKRGSGVNVNGGKPVGKADGYSGRKTQSSGSHQTSSGNHQTSGGGYQSSGSGSYNRASGSERSLLGTLLGLVSTSNSSSSSSSSSSPLGGITKLLKTNKTVRIIAIILVLAIVWYLFSNGYCSNCGSIISNGNFSTGDELSYGVAGETATESDANLSVSNLARSKRTQIVGGKNDVVTIMIYMCGTDLESKYGMATYDLKEMMAATISDNVNVVVLTGGAKAWKNSTVSSSVNQIYKVTSKGLVRLEDNFGSKAMVDPTNLTDFIQYCKTKFPANRNMLIMWDHGGGSVSGYGYDEKNSGAGSMSLDKINSALKNAGCTFDFIGFDACLMATLETALVCEQYADYMIASEETEPGVGWYYTTWLTELSNNTSIGTVELGKTIIDTFVKAAKQNSPNDKTTLSIVDLAELAGTVPESFNSFATSTTQLINTDLQQVSNARSKTKEFSSGINQVDLIHLAENIGSPESKNLANALKACVKYNRTSTNIANANGISIFFPYGGSSQLTTAALNTYSKIGLDNSYSNCIKSFSSVCGGGQVLSGGTSYDSLFDSIFSDSSAAPSSGAGLMDVISLLGGSGSTGGSSDTTSQLIGTALNLFLSNRSMSADMTGIDVGQNEEWFDADAVAAQQDYYAEHYLDPARLVPSIKEGKKVVHLSDEEWDLVQDVQLNVFYDDGEGYIDLGMDNTYEFDNDGDLVLGYDGTWLTINGNVVSYYMISNDTHGSNYVITGRVPALLTNADYENQLVDIILVFDNEHEDGIVAGARINYNGETGTVAKGLIELKEGDAIDFLCDYYTYDGDYISSYYLGEQFIVPAGELTISNMFIGDAPCKITYCLTDLYGNEMWTPALDY